MANRRWLTRREQIYRSSLTDGHRASHVLLAGWQSVGWQLHLMVQLRLLICTRWTEQPCHCEGCRLARRQSGHWQAAACSLSPTISVQEKLLSWPAAVCRHPGHEWAEPGEAAVDCSDQTAHHYLPCPAWLALCEGGLQMVVCWHAERESSELGQGGLCCPAQNPESRIPCPAWLVLCAGGLQMVVGPIAQASESWHSKGPAQEGSGHEGLVRQQVSCLLMGSFEACACQAMDPQLWQKQHWQVQGGLYSSQKLQEECQEEQLRY